MRVSVGADGIILTSMGSTLGRGGAEACDLDPDLENVLQD